MHHHISLISTNSKLGPIPATTADRETCAPDCPFKNAGCYAENYPFKFHWDAVSKGKRGTDWSEHVAEISNFPGWVDLWRAHVGGDLKHTLGKIDTKALYELVEANGNKRGFTYTHHVMNKHNLHAVQVANSCGFTINASANNLAHADELAALGLPVAVVLPADQRENTKTPGGRSVIVCPQQIKDDITCASCQLCARGDRSTIIGFIAHGTRSGKADAVARRVISIKSV